MGLKSTPLATAAAAFGMLIGLLSGTVVAAPAALAYQGCNTSSSATASPSVVDPNQPVDFSVTLRDCNGNAIAGARVTFSQGAAPAGCKATFSPTIAVTDANGRASTTVTLPAGCPCQYTLVATGGGTTVTTTVRENGCLPFTGAALPVPGSGSTSAALLPLVTALGVGLIAATALALRRRAG